ncbi:MAG: hypothetical protein ACJ0SL_04770, partial [Candidatus Rariloculaceae bacterium]
ITTAGLEERFRDDAEGRFLNRLAGQPPLDGEEAAPAVLRDHVTRLIELGLRDRQNALIRRGSALNEAQRAELASISARLSADQDNDSAS